MSSPLFLDARINQWKTAEAVAVTELGLHMHVHTRCASRRRLVGELLAVIASTGRVRERPRIVRETRQRRCRWKPHCCIVSTW